MTTVYCLRMGWFEPAAIAKVFASAGFILAALSAGVLETRFGRAILAGLILSMVGDMALISPSREFFLVGLSAFLLAHIAYITGFVGYGQDRRRVLIAAGPVVVAAVAVLAWMMPYASDGLAMPVRIYTAVISLMLITAFGAQAAGASKLIVAGAIMFFLSDLSVASLRVVGTDFPAYVWGMPFYYAGQLCIGLGAAATTAPPESEELA